MAKSREAFRTITEVADWLDTPAHVLRFWESKFPQIKPVKRAGGRRYYRPEDMALLGGIKTLLHEDGLTIKGAQKLLREKGVRHVSDLGPSPMDAQDDDMIEGRLTESPGQDGAAAPEEGPEAADTGPHTPQDDSLPAFLRRAPAMPAPVPPDPAEDPPALMDAPGDTPPPLATPRAAQHDAPTAADRLPEDAPAQQADSPADPLRGDAGPEEAAATPAPPAPQVAIAETADLVAALARSGSPELAPPPAEPRVISETPAPGTELQPELPFGTLRPLPVKRTARAKSAPRTARTTPASALPENEPATKPGLLSLLAGAEQLAADPVRLATALARLEALRDRPGP